MAESVIALPRACAAWGQADFLAVLKDELEACDVHALPLQAGLVHTSAVADAPLVVVPLGLRGAAAAQVGVHYAGLLAGCNCSDDPGVIEAQAEYCELLIQVHPQSGRARVSLAADVG